jgi:hypothetical protein
MSKQLMIVVGLIGVLAASALGLSIYTMGRNQSAGPQESGRQPVIPALQGQQSAEEGKRAPNRVDPLPGPGGEPQALRQGQSAGAVAVEEPREIAPDKVRGTIIDTGWRTYVVRSQDTGKKYSFAFGRITKYNRRQRLDTGARITVTYRYDRKRLVATYIQIH